MASLGERRGTVNTTPPGVRVLGTVYGTPGVRCQYGDDITGDNRYSKTPEATPGIYITVCRMEEARAYTAESSRDICGLYQKHRLCHLIYCLTKPYKIYYGVVRTSSIA